MVTRQQRGNSNIKIKYCRRKENGVKVLTFAPFFVIVFLKEITPPRGVVVKWNST